MSQTGKSIRLNRIFRSASKRALIVAYDHALMLGPIPGTEDPAPYLRRFAACGVDGVLVSLGTLRNCVDAFLAPQPPAVIARLDWTNVWHRAGNVGSASPCRWARPGPRERWPAAHPGLLCVCDSS